MKYIGKDEEQACQQRLECYRLAVVQMSGPNFAFENGRDWIEKADLWASHWHQRIYGGPMPPVKEEEPTVEGTGPWDYQDYFTRLRIAE